MSFRSPGQKFGTTRGDLTVGGDLQRLFSYPMYRDLAAEQSVVHRHRGALLVPREHGGRRGHDAARRAPCSCPGNYFDVLNVRPELGRFIGPEDARVVGESLVAVLSYELLAEQFRRRPERHRQDR